MIQYEINSATNVHWDTNWTLSFCQQLTDSCMKGRHAFSHCRLTKLQEANTHKSANTHAGNVFVTGDLDPKNKWVSPRLIMEHYYVKFYDSNCIGFWDIVQENRHRQKQQNRVLCHPLGFSGNVHGSSMAGWKARVDFLLVLIEHFSPALTVEALWADIGRNCCARRGWVTLSANLRGNEPSPTNDCWRQKNRVPGISCGVVCVILRLAVLVQYRRVTDGHTMTASITLA